MNGVCLVAAIGEQNGDDFPDRIATHLGPSVAMYRRTERHTETRFTARTHCVTAMYCTVHR